MISRYHFNECVRSHLCYTYHIIFFDKLAREGNKYFFGYLMLLLQFFSKSKHAQISTSCTLSALRLFGSLFNAQYWYHYDPLSEINHIYRFMRFMLNAFTCHLPLCANTPYVSLAGRCLYGIVLCKVTDLVGKSSSFRGFFPLFLK